MRVVVRSHDGPWRPPLEKFIQHMCMFTCISIFMQVLVLRYLHIRLHSFMYAQQSLHVFSFTFQRCISIHIITSFFCFMPFVLSHFSCIKYSLGTWSKSLQDVSRFWLSLQHSAYHACYTFICDQFHLFSVVFLWSIYFSHIFSMYSLSARALRFIHACTHLFNMHAANYCNCTVLFGLYLLISLSLVY